MGPLNLFGGAIYLPGGTPYLVGLCLPFDGTSYLPGRVRWLAWWGPLICLVGSFGLPGGALDLPGGVLWLAWWGPLLAFWGPLACLMGRFDLPFGTPSLPGRVLSCLVRPHDYWRSA